VKKMKLKWVPLRFDLLVSKKNNRHTSIMLHISLVSYLSNEFCSYYTVIHHMTKILLLCQVKSLRFNYFKKRYIQ